MTQRPFIWQTAVLLTVVSTLLCSAFTPAIHGRNRVTHSIRPSGTAWFDREKAIPSPSNSAAPAFFSPLWQQRPKEVDPEPRPNRWRRVLQRLDTIQSAGLDENAVLTAGLFGKIKKLHDPITYFVLGILAGFRWDWCFRNPLYWFAIGFTIKWFRARYVFKIPVWDRQPNWNNVITSKEQEKDLKALTCKNCGSTIFIAKTREFFFEGGTGIGGLGCFTCGAKGKDNFVSDRDRIVEDVGDMDDYFEYERPLDFVSRAERRKLLKEAKGDEDKANQLLLERETGGSAPPAVEEPVTAEEKPKTEVNGTRGEVTESNDAETIEAKVEQENPEPELTNPTETKAKDVEKDPKPVTKETEPAETKAEHVEKDSKPLATNTEPSVEKHSPPKKASIPKKKTVAASSSTSKGGLDLDGLDALDMDAF